MDGPLSPYKRSFGVSCVRFLLGKDFAQQRRKCFFDTFLFW
jgi:hypothetical protein